MNYLPFEYERKEKIKGKDVWQKARVFGTLKDMREYWVKHPRLAPNEPFKKMMLDSIDLAVAGKIKPSDIFNTAVAKYKALFGNQRVTLIREKEE